MSCNCLSGSLYDPTPLESSNHLDIQKIVKEEGVEFLGIDPTRDVYRFKFDHIKCMITYEFLKTYPEHNERVYDEDGSTVVHIDARTAEDVEAMLRIIFKNMIYKEMMIKR